jgi:hypothetical protein
MTALAVAERTLSNPVLEALRRVGNPFRNYFARNPDDDVCARFHVPELYAAERSQLQGVVELYRTTPGLHAELVPVLGNKGSGKTHLLHSIKHASGGAFQLLVTPGTYQRDSDFLEYLLFQVMDTLLGGGKQKGRRPLEFFSEELGRSLLKRAVESSGKDGQLDLFPPAGLGRWARRLGLGGSQAQEQSQWLLDALSRPTRAAGFAPLRRICADCNLPEERACDFVCKFIEKSEGHSAADLMRRHIHQGLIRAALLGDESDLANFLTYGFAELDFKVRPSRQDLVLALFKVLMEILQSQRVPVVVAFDQLEDLLLARRSEEGQRTAEAFFAGIVKAMHQIEGVCFLVFAERGLWNRFVPSLDGYIQDRLNNPIHLPGHGTIKTLRLEAPPEELVFKVVEARMKLVHDELPRSSENADGDTSSIFPFTPEQVAQIARTEPTLRDMLQQFRQLFDHLVYGAVQKTAYETADPVHRPEPVSSRLPAEPMQQVSARPAVIVESTSPPKPVVVEPSNTARPVMVESKFRAVSSGTKPPANLAETWDQQMQEALGNLRPEGALTGATRELQAGLGNFLKTCHEHGVKFGPWRLRHVVPEWTFGEHPTYGLITIAHWACGDAKAWKLGIGLFLGRGNGKSKDLEIKLGTLEVDPAVVDLLILLRPEDDLALTGKSKTLWRDAEARGRHLRLEPVSIDSFAILYGFPRWLASLGEALPQGQPLPNLADLLQDKCEKLLEQVCMPVTN